MLSVELISPPIGDPGAASAIMDLNRKEDSTESQYGVFGDGMTVTGATIETARPGVARVYLTTPTGGDPGLYVADDLENILVSTIGGNDPGTYIYDVAGYEVGRMVGGTNPGLFFRDNLGNDEARVLGNSAAPGLYVYNNGVLSGQVIGGVLAGLYACDSTGAVIVTMNQQGLSLKTGGTTERQIRWLSGSSLAGYLDIEPNAPSVGGYLASLVAYDGSSGYIQIALQAIPGGSEFAVFMGTTGSFSLQPDGSGYFTGDVYARGVKLTSDEAIKQDIADLSEGISAQLHNLRPRSFRYQGQSRTAHGLVAQEVEKVLPQLVESHRAPRHPDDDAATNEDKLLSVDYGGLVTLLLAEIQDLHSRVKQLEATHGR